MARFYFEKDFGSLHIHANKLCNTIDDAALGSHKGTGGCDPTLNIAKKDRPVEMLKEHKKLGRHGGGLLLGIIV